MFDYLKDLLYMWKKEFREVFQVELKCNVLQQKVEQCFKKTTFCIFLVTFTVNTPFNSGVGLDYINDVNSLFKFYVQTLVFKSRLRLFSYSKEK